MSLLELYAEAKTWQQGIGALLGFLGLMIAALFNFKLNRRRDARLREEEMKAVAAALYGEMRLLRARVAKVARAVARTYITQGLDGRSGIRFDSHFFEAHKMPEATLYKSLAPRFGLLSADLLIPIASFYEHISEVAAWLPRMGDDPTRGYSYDVRYVLEPARDAVIESASVLRNLEDLVGVPVAGRVKPLSLGDIDDVISMQEVGDHG